MYPRVTFSANAFFTNLSRPQTNMYIAALHVCLEHLLVGDKKRLRKMS